MRLAEPGAIVELVAPVLGLVGPDVGPAVTSGEHWAELKQRANGSVLFRFGDASEDRRARNAVLLRYGNEAKEVRIVKRWAGRAKVAEPDGKPAGNLGDACTKVVARMVACEKDPASVRSWSPVTTRPRTLGERRVYRHHLRRPDEGRASRARGERRERVL